MTEWPALFSRIIMLSALILAVTSCTQPPVAHQSKTKAKSPVEGKPRSLPTVIVHEAFLKRTVRIPAELVAFRDVAIHPKVQGFVQHVRVDRGSQVKQGQVLIEIVAPELEANYQESVAKYETAASALAESQSSIANYIAQKEEAEAKAEADEANLKRIQVAAQTPGAVAPVDIEEAQKNLQGSKAHVRAAEQATIGARSELESQRGRIRSAKQALKSMAEMKAYLTVRAPFDGTITERNVHEGSLVSSNASSQPMLKIQETSKLRLLVPVPEEDIAGVKLGGTMKFTVPAFVGKTFAARIARISHGLDRKTRTMIIELDVPNSNQTLEPGMYAEVVWQMERPYQTTFVPASAIVNAGDQTSVIKVTDGKAEVVPVKRGQSMGRQVEVVGIAAGDQIVLDASDDIKAGMAITGQIQDGETPASEHGEHE